MSVLKERAIEDLLARARRSGRRTLTEPESKAILKLAGIPAPRETLARTAAEAAEAARQLGFPVVLKIVSPDIPHKSDAGGVRLGVSSPAAVRKVFVEILASAGSRCPGARLEGVLVQETVRGLEVIAGTMTDRQFGPVLMFGLGGVFVEALDDVAFRIIPIDRGDARGILAGIRGARLLNGFRGSRPVNREKLASVLVNLSSLAGRFRDSIREIDINPLMATGDGSVAVDGLITLHEGSPA
jgi:succinyl-CoA synthetase beta subunit